MVYRNNLTLMEHLTRMVMEVEVILIQEVP